MQAVVLVIVLIAIYLLLIDYKTPSQRIKEMDKQPNSFKSDDWLRKYGKL